VCVCTSTGTETSHAVRRLTRLERENQFHGLHIGSQDIFLEMLIVTHPVKEFANEVVVF
jgi:hypothetical protein